MTSTKFARFLFIPFGILMPIFIGILHSYAHFKDLIKPNVQEYLTKEIEILGEIQNMWHTWAIVSLMMGISFIVIGLLNLSILKTVPKNKPLPISAVISMILYLSAVIYVGHTYDGAMQFYGGIAGMLMALLCLGATIKSKATNS